MKRIIYTFLCLFIGISLSVPLLYNDNHRLNAATNYSTGSKVFIGNDSYTVIDPNTMTLLKDTATDAGEVTWNDAVASLNNLAGNYGELGSKIVSNKFTLPKTSDLTSIMNTGNTALVTIDTINTDWWLGDESVDNRSKFVGANTNSLVTDVSIIKNVLDKENKVCNMEQTVTEQGIKVTQNDTDPETIARFPIPSYFKISQLQYPKGGIVTYEDEDCAPASSHGRVGGAIGDILNLDTDTMDWKKAMMDVSGSYMCNFVLIQKALDELGMEAYLKEYLRDPSQGLDKKFQVTVNPGVCQNLKNPTPSFDFGNGTLHNIRSFMFEIGTTPSTIEIQADLVPEGESTIRCPGHAQTAGTSSVRPLLTLDKSIISYSSASKPMFNISSAINQPVPEIGNYPYLTLKDSDLGIGLDSSNPDVSGNTLTVDRSNTTVSIPVSLSGTTSGDRYISAVATTNSGERYSVLGQVNGNTGTVQLDLTSLANYQTAKTLSLTLYQEVDEGTKTTYRGNGTQITLDFGALPITDITFTPNYPSGKTSWTEGDAGINAAGAKTGTFTFTGGTSGVNDPTSGKDYKKWEIVDASGNPTTDANFSITNNELFAKKKITKGTYTLKIKITDNENETFTKTITITVTGHPVPTLEYNPTSSTLTYGDNPTKVNNTIGTFTLSYPTGQPTSNIASIQLGTGGDESHFSIDTSGNLKVKGADLDAGTYSVTVSGKDGNGVDFTKTVSITVAKKNQDNYQITNSSNYSLQVNQEINITTTGNDSGENETYTITNGNSVAQIVGNKFKLLSAGTFTLQATVGGNTNYNSKTVTKQITVSQLPTQNPPVSITSKDSIMYGETYTPSYSGGQGSGAVSWSIETDNGTGAVLSNGKVTVTGVGTFTIKVTKAGTSSYQESTATKVITVNKRKTIVKPKDVTKTVGQAFKDNGATYNPQPVTGDNIGTLTITSKYPDNQAAGKYTDGIQASGLSNPNYEFEYQEGTLIINSNSLPNNGEGYYKVTGTKGKNNWYISDVEISATGKNGYDEISNDGISFQSSALVYSADGDYQTEFYLKNSSTGAVAKAIRYQLKIDQTPPDVPTLSMKEINKSAIARFINALSFGNWMNQAAEVTMTSSDATSGLDYYEYTETSKDGTNTKQSTSGIVTYQNDVELTIQAKACDKAGNCSDLSSDEGIMIDRKAPTITGVKDKSEYKFYYLPRFVKVTDDYSGLSYSEYKKDGVMAGTIQDNIDEEISSVGEYEIYAEDNAGNEITITFKIVALPDIETEIDGSDESKDIIDQVIDELDEIKDKIDETEKKDIEDWIKDALDKWNSLRKKVVETDDKSAKVEGQGDTDFDPSVILIVDDITDHADDIPPLPRKPITVYDVWLQKGNVKIQPDGSIKVYLPYVEKTTAVGYAMGGAKSDAKPIVYEIDEKDKVKELKVQHEGNFVTFITDELLRYAISNDKQELNKDDTCVVGPDGKPTTGDEVCGLPNDDGKQPVKKPDGSVEVPDGGKIEFPNGTEIDTPDGAIIHPDGSVTLPDGTEYDPDGNKKPSKQCKLDGTKLNIDTDGDGLPDVNIDLDKDCIADINVDMNGDNIPDLNIDSNGDGKPDINIDKNDDGKADLNILKITKWKPDKDVTINGITYDTMAGLIPDVNIDFDGDGNPDYNIDTDGDGIPDKNLIDDNSSIKNNLGGANTGDNTKWVYWWILLIITTLTMIYAQYKKRQMKRNKQKETVYK